MPSSPSPKATSLLPFAAEGRGVPASGSMLESDEPIIGAMCPGDFRKGKVAVTSGRFSNLEFDDGADKGQPPAQKAGAPLRHARFVAEDRDAGHCVRQAEAQELAGDHEAALRSFSAALGEDPLLFDAWLGQARMLVELGEYPEARLWVDKALEKLPDNPQLLAVKSMAMYRMGLCHDARALNDTALQGKGESALVWVCRGELMLADRRAAADECFAHAKRLANPKGPTLMHIGAAYLRCGHYSLAMATLQEAAAAIPKAARVWYLLGRTQHELGLTSQANVSLAQARQLAPDNARYRDAAAAKGSGGAVRGILRRLFGR